MLKLVYRELSEKEKDIKYGINRYKNISEENKQILKEYNKNYLQAKK